MNLKTVTFRCSESLLNRLENAMNTLACENRTTVLATALEEFLHFAAQKEVGEMNLFEMVKHIDTLGSAKQFASQS